MITISLSQGERGDITAIMAITLAAMREQFADVIEGTAKPVSKKKPKQVTNDS